MIPPPFYEPARDLALEFLHLPPDEREQYYGYACVQWVNASVALSGGTHRADPVGVVERHEDFDQITLPVRSDTNYLAPLGAHAFTSDPTSPLETWAHHFYALKVIELLARGDFMPVVPGCVQHIHSLFLEPSERGAAGLDGLGEISLHVYCDWFSDMLEIGQPLSDLEGQFLERMVCAVSAHLALLALAPFGGGNEPLARTLAALPLLCQGFPPIVHDVASAARITSLVARRRGAWDEASRVPPEDLNIAMGIVCERYHRAADELMHDSGAGR